VGELTDDVSDLGRNRSAANGGEEAGIRRLDDHVRPDANGIGAAAAYLADEDAGNGEDHDDFNGNSQYANGNTNRAVKQVAEDQLVHEIECNKAVTGG
jgi:hypothetical protein